MIERKDKVKANRQGGREAESYSAKDILLEILLIERECFKLFLPASLPTCLLALILIK